MRSSLITYCCAVLCLVIQSCPNLCDPLDYSSPSSFVHGDSPGKNIGVAYLAFLQGIFPSGIKPRSPALQVNSLPSEPPGKPNNVLTSAIQNICPNVHLELIIEITFGFLSLSPNTLRRSLPIGNQTSFALQLL